MKLSERWRIAGIIVRETRFKGQLEANPANLARVKENADLIGRRIKSSTRITSLVTTVIICTLAAVTIGSSALYVTLGELGPRFAIGLSFFLLLSFVVIIFMNLTATTGFFSAGAMKLPATLPLSQKDLEGLTFMAFIRAFIIQIVVILTVAPLMILFFFGWVPFLLALLACGATASLSIGSLVKLTKWFHVKSISTDDSKVSAIVRISASLGMAIGMILVFSFGSFMPAIIEIIGQLATSAGPEVYTGLAIIFPFSYGILTSAMTQSVMFEQTTVLVALAAVGLYSLLAILSYQKTQGTLRAVALGNVATSTATKIRLAAVDIATPLRAIIRKDLKLATRNIGSVFVFVIPLFLLMMMIPMFWGWSQQEALRSRAVLVAVEYANIFGGIGIVSVLRFDAQGASIQEGLPIATTMTLEAKAVIALIPYLASMVILTLSLLFFPLILPVILLIPIIQLPLGFGLAFLTGAVLYRIRGGGRATSIDFSSDPGIAFFAAAIGGIAGIAPLLGYAGAMILTGQHIFSFLAQAVIVAVEMLLILRAVPKMLKD
ncbi:MAG: hypothetical protein EAX95_07100 [Candidatus Thorarchaeota archaeon]|nr:hypothetical protein [Candidatus Thorarchaeota archaeon]